MQAHHDADRCAGVRYPNDRIGKDWTNDGPMKVIVTFGNHTLSHLTGANV